MVGSEEIRPGAAQPFQAPYYLRKSVVLGGGAVGLAPFHLYTTDCVPPHDPAVSEKGLMFDELDGPNGMVLVRFYGPITRKNGNQTWAQHVRVQCRPFNVNNSMDPCNWVADVSSAVNIYGPGPGQLGPSGQAWTDRRSIGIKPKFGNHLKTGVYMVYPVAADSVVCDELADKPPVVWDMVCDNGFGDDRPAYVFVVSGDCDHDGIADQLDPDTHTCITTCVMADFNHSGTVTVQDIFDFLTSFFAADLQADVNASGTVTVQDLFDYLGAFFGCGTP